MATAQSFLDNFPVKFNNELGSCLECDTREFCQLAQWNDRFEFAIEPSTTDVTVVNPNFTSNLSGWTAGTGWTWVAGAAKATLPSGTLSQTISVIAGRKYKVSFTALPVTLNPSITVVLGNVGSSVALGGGVATYSVYIVAGNTSGLIFQTAATSTFYIDSVTVELVSEDCGIELYNTETGTYSGIRKYANLGHASIGTIGYSYLWSDMGVLYDACYKIVVYDTSGVNLITNGTFNTNLNGWSITLGAPIWLAGKAHFAEPVWPQYLRQFITAPINSPLRLTFTISSSATIGDGVIDVYYGAQVLATNLIANGTYTIDFIASTANDEIQFNSNSSGTGTTLDIDNVSLLLLSCTQSALSECYNIKTDQGCTTKMLSWTNGAVNGFNYPYLRFYNATNQYGFQWMRIEADLRNSKYPGQEEKYIDSGGNNKLYYSSSRKQKELIIGAIPEYMHDALSIGLLHKEFYIDGVRYSFEDSDYTPQWSSEIPTILAESQVLVGKYTQDLKQID